MLHRTLFPHRRSRTLPTTPNPTHTQTPLRGSKGAPPIAQKVEVHLEDDLDGGPADHTLTFALDGKDYEIDLSDANTEKLREVFRPYATTARKTTRGGGPRGTRTHASSSDPDTARIRAQAKDNGHPLSDRGRIHQSVKDAYYAAH